MVKGQGKLSKNWKRVASTIFIEHPDWNAGQIHRQLIMILGDSKSPSSVSSVQKLLPDWRKHYNPDSPWSLGAYTPQADIQPLLSLQRQLTKHGRYLTIRRARWYAVLYPVLLPLLEQTYPSDLTQN